MKILLLVESFQGGNLQSGRKENQQAPEEVADWKWDKNGLYPAILGDNKNAVRVRPVA